ncbi:NifB/NifX family molybdenum-iron cluster-binding protein [Desulfovirgula thermocuniculi]|uniref:NifB/NifX family molybdenum-iron cluster-binding protein n=1 Tax=Desulfovirgula thermocuniculi TaxID=348842 RepID=UPI00054FC669|nr:NifB/NifX family molybdenum-iron cluster-binding protein [Desulfovirgula thermocuniculi]
MKVAICAQGTHLDAPMDLRFGRCPYFVVADPQTGEWEHVPNPGPGAAGGAGIQAAQLMIKLKVDAVITGRLGPNAMEVLKKAGIKVYEGTVGTVRQNLEAYRQNRLPLLTQPNAPGGHKP